MPTRVVPPPAGPANGRSGSGALGSVPDQRALQYDGFFAAEWPDLLGYLRRAVRDMGLAEDLAQETFLRAAQGLATFRGDSSPRTWLRRIADNVLRDHWRSRTAQATRLLGPLATEVHLQLPDPGDSPALAVERRHVQGCLESLVARLPSGEAEALILAVGHSMPPREIARNLGVTPEAARARLHRARRKLAAMVAERCVLAADEGGGLSCEGRGSGAPAASLTSDAPASAARLSS